MKPIFKCFIKRMHEATFFLFLHPFFKKDGKKTTTTKKPLSWKELTGIVD